MQSQHPSSMPKKGSTFPAAVRAAATTMTKTATTRRLTYVATFAWKTCHVDASLLLVALAPPACTAFAASLRGAATSPGWQLLFSWQAALPLFFLACCCAVTYRAACKRQHSRRHTNYKYLNQSSPLTPVQSSCVPSSHLRSASTPSLGVSLRSETTLFWGGKQQRLHYSKQDLHLHNDVSFTYRGNSLRGGQSLIPPKQLQCTPHQHVVPHVRALRKPLHAEQPGKRSRNTDASVKVVSTIACTQPQRAQPFLQVLSAVPARRHDSAVRPAASSFWRLALGGYSEGKRMLESCCSDSDSADSPSSPAPTKERAAKRPFSRGFPRSPVSEPSPAAAPPRCSKSPADVAGAQLPKKSCLCLRSLPKHQRLRRIATETAGRHYFSVLSFTVRFAHTLVKRTLQRLSFFARQKSNTVRHSFSPATARTSTCHCVASISKRVIDNPQDSGEEEESNSRESEQKAVCTVLTGQEGKTGMSEAVAAGKIAAAARSRGDSVAQHDFHSKRMREHMQDATAASLKTCRRRFFFHEWQPLRCSWAASTAEASARVEEPADSMLVSSRSLSADPASEAVSYQERRQSRRRQSRCASSAVVAALLFPSFLCCYFPFTQRTAAIETAYAATLKVGQADTSFVPFHLYGSAREPSTGHSRAPAEPLLSSCGAPFVLQAVLSLLPSSLVAGSLVCLLLWHSPAASVRLREIVWLISVYVTLSVATWLFSAYNLGAAARVIDLPSQQADALAGRNGSVLPFLVLIHGKSRMQPFWTGTSAGVLFQVEQIAVLSVCAAIIGFCMTLQLLCFYACFRKAPRCFSLVEGSLVAQLATALTYVCVAFSYCSWYISPDEGLRSKNSRPNLPHDTEISHKQTSSVGAFHSSTSQDAPVLMEAAPAISSLSIESGWRIFAAHLWLLLLVFIACTLLLTGVDDQRCGGVDGGLEKRRALSPCSKEKRAQDRTEEQGSEKSILRIFSMDIVAFLFVVAVVGYLFAGCVLDLRPAATLRAEGLSCSSRGSARAVFKCTTRSKSCDIFRDSRCSNDSNTDGGGESVSAQYGVKSVSGNGGTSKVAQRPLAWILRFIFSNTHHTLLFLCWSTLSAVGISCITRVASRADFLESANGIVPYIVAPYVSASSKPANSEVPCGMYAARGMTQAGQEDKVNKTKASSIKVLARKLFHLLLVAVVASGYYAGAYEFTALCLCGLLWLLVFCEYLRVSRILPQLSSQLTIFFRRFADSRDKNGLFLTHAYLLLGVALPFVAAAAQGDLIVAGTLTMVKGMAPPHFFLATGGVSQQPAQLQNSTLVSATTYVNESREVSHLQAASALAAPLEYVEAAETEACAEIHFSSFVTLQSLLGLLLVGVGDAVAALVGIRWGSKKMPLTKNKTCLGAAAFFAASASLMMILVLSGKATIAEKWLTLRAGFVATGLATLYEVYTPDIDNAILSLFGVVAYNAALLIPCRNTDHFEIRNA